MNNLNASKGIREAVVWVVLAKVIPHKSINYPCLLQGPGHDDRFSPRPEKGIPTVIMRDPR